LIEQRASPVNKFDYLWTLVLSIAELINATEAEQQGKVHAERQADERVWPRSIESDRVG
jgi:hypothetical protein